MACLALDLSNPFRADLEGFTCGGGEGQAGGKELLTISGLSWLVLFWLVKKGN